MVVLLVDEDGPSIVSSENLRIAQNVNAASKTNTVSEGALRERSR
jgi:hypothetical protein